MPNLIKQRFNPQSTIKAFFNKYRIRKNPKMKKADRLKFLEDYCEEESIITINRGHVWFRETLFPILVQAEKKDLAEKDLLAEAHVLIGEVYELIYAPLKAVEQYKKALHLNPHSSFAHEWMSALQEQLGNYIPALNHIEEAIKLAPEEESLMWNRQRVQDCMVYDKEPEIDFNLSLWKYGESLVNQQFDGIIKTLTNPLTEDFEELRCLAAAYGAKNDATNYSIIQEKIESVESSKWEQEEFDVFYQIKKTVYR